MSEKNDIVIGIDLGTTNSLGAFFAENRPFILAPEGDNGVVPSIVSFTASGVLVGKEAKKQLEKNFATTVYSAKRFFGRSFTDVQKEKEQVSFELTGDDRSLKFKVGERELTPFEVSAEVLRTVCAQAAAVLGQPVTKAVITVPAYFDDAQRNETKAAAAVAGLEVLRIINEPTAAALAYGLDQKQQGKIAVYDLGGGTFDISVLDLQSGVFKVLSTNGNTRLGGDDFDLAIVNWLLEKVPELKDYVRDPQVFSALRLTAEKLKIALSDAEKVPVELSFAEGKISFKGELTRSEFEELIANDIARTVISCKKALKDAGLKTPDITELVLVGGSTRIPAVRKAVKEFFNRTPFVGLNPDEVVALGAAVQAQILSGGKRDVLLLDVIPLSLGIETLGGAVTKILLRNTTIPTSHTDEFTTSVDKQTAIIIHVLQGERELVEDCRSLARFKVKIPPMPAGLPRLQVTFAVDENGILTAKAVEKRTGSSAQIEVNPAIGLSRDEMNRVIEESIYAALDDFSARNVVELRNKIQRVVISTEQNLSAAQENYPEDQYRELLDSLEESKSMLSAGSRDLDKLKAAAERIGNLTRPLADVLMSRATKDALVGKKADQV
jgi:Fe-S protein assembly chaperone HscA